MLLEGRRVSSHPRIGVVIAAYNAAYTLDAALASVAAQSVRPVRVVVVDDCSTDGSREIAEAWRRLLPLTVIALTTNQGPSSARHVGILACECETVAVLDADDYWMPDHLATMHQIWDRSGGLISARALVWVPGVGTRISSRHNEDPPPSRLQPREILVRNFVFVGTLYAKAAYEAAGGYRPGLRGTEDWDLWIRMIRAGARVRRPGHPTYVYRLSESSLSSDGRLVDEELSLFRRLAMEASGPAERNLALRGVRRTESRQHLVNAYRLARLHHRSRREALQALRGSPRVRIRALLMLLSPSIAVRLRDQRAGSRLRRATR
jgi:glycosyltransferase involved in cell wall biosynthesis